MRGAGDLGTELVIATRAADQRYPAGAWDAAGGGYAVAWQEGTSGADIHGTILDGVGVALAGAETLSGAGNAQERPALSYDTDRGASWQCGRTTGTAAAARTSTASLQGVHPCVNYEYDGLYRLTEAAYSDGAYYGYGYDAVGNRLAYTNTTAPVTLTTYVYDAADRLSSLTRAGVQTSYSWTDRGELLSDGVQNYTWDAAGRLVGVTGPEDLDVSYTYDGANNRVEMTVDGAATTYIVDPFNPVDSVSQVLRETTGGQTTRNLYGLDLFAQQQGATTTYLGYDALSVRLHLDGSGAIAATYRYGPYGEVVGAGPAGYGYTGEQWDRYTELLYLRARYYRFEVGAFASRDIRSGDNQHSMTLNRYLYALANPVNHTDPSGFAADSCGGVGGCPDLTQLWDPLWINSVGDKRGAELAFCHFVADPQYFVNLYMFPEKWHRDVEWALLDIFFQYSYLHGSAADAVEGGLDEADRELLYSINLNYGMGDREGAVALRNCALIFGSAMMVAGQIGGDIPGGGETCLQCGTFRPDLYAGAGNLHIDPDGQSMWCNACRLAGQSNWAPRDGPKGKILVLTWEEAELMAQKIGAKGPRWTGPAPDHFGIFEGGPTPESDPEMYRKVNAWWKALERTKYGDKNR